MSVVPVTLEETLRTINMVVTTDPSAEFLGDPPADAKLLCQGSIITFDSEDKLKGSWVITKVQKRQIQVTSLIAASGKALPSNKQVEGVTCHTIKFVDIPRASTKILPAAFGSEAVIGWRGASASVVGCKGG